MTSTSDVQGTEEAVCPGDGCENTVAWTFVKGPNDARFPPIPPPCPSCAADLELSAEREAEQQAASDLEATVGARRQQWPRVASDLGINVRDLGHCALDNFEAGESGRTPIAAAWRFVQETSEAPRWAGVRGLYLHGETGTGKSHIAVAILRELYVNRGWAPKHLCWVSALELVIQLRDTYRSSRDTWSVLRRPIEAGVLVIDEWGATDAGSDVIRAMTLLISRRAKCPTVITSNLSPGQLAKASPDGIQRIVSRLGREYMQVEKLTGQDARHRGTPRSVSHPQPGGVT